MLGYLLNPALQLEDINGLPLVGGWLTVYRAGTTFPYITCRDFDMNRNPVNIVLDERGMAVILAESDGLYDVYAYDRNGVQQWSRLNVCTIGAGGGGDPSDHKRCVHRLLRYYTNASDADANHPVGDWLHDLDGVDPEDPSGYPMVRAEDLFYWLSEGQIFVLYEVDSLGGLEKWNAPYQLCTWQDQSEWWSQYAPEPGKAVRIEFVRLGAYSTPYRSNMIAYIRYKDEEFMRLYEIMPGQSVWTAEYQEKLPYYSSNWHNGDFLRVKIDGSSLEWAPVSIPTVNDAVLTIQKNGTDVATFSANSASDKIANIEVPTKTSDIQNDSGFITSSDIPAVNNGTLTIQKNGSSVATFTANSSSNVTADISVPEYTAGTDVKISNQNVISSLHGLKSYSRTQAAGGDMVEDDLLLYVYHICPPTMVNNVRINNMVYEYKVTDVTNCLWIDLRHVLTPNSDGYVTNMHYILDFTGPITDNSDAQYVDPNKDSILLCVGYGDPKAQIAGYSARYIPVKFGNKYLVDIYGNVAHVSLLGADRIQNIADNFGDVHETLSTTPQTTTYTFEYKLDLSTAYHLDILTNALQAESTDKIVYRIAIGIPGAQNNKYLTGWNRIDSGKSITQHLDFVSTNYSTRWFIEFDRDNYPLATQSVNLMIVGTKERL